MLCSPPKVYSESANDAIMHSTHINDPRKEEDNAYVADAEVEVEFAGGIGQTSRQPGMVFYFKLKQIPPPGLWVGHLDYENPRPGQGWPRET
jgi:hypothetical protein